jgi:hypothetical protein
MPRQIAAIEVGKHAREDGPDDADNDGFGTKRPRMKVAEIDVQAPRCIEEKLLDDVAILVENLAYRPVATSK